MIEEYNDKLATVYDKATKEEFKWMAPKKIAQNLLPFAKKGDAVLDLGCGTGQSAGPFIEKGCNVIGIDISSKMLKIAKENHKFQELYKHNIEKGVKEVGLKKDSFDIVIAVGILEFIKNLKKCLWEMTELTKPGGYIAFTYELLLENHKFQSMKVSPLVQGIIEPIPKLLSFEVYRYTPIEIEKILNENRIIKIYSEKFIGYLKTEDKIPVYDELIIGGKR